MKKQKENAATEPTKPKVDPTSRAYSVLVVIPTYCESENIEELIRGVFASLPDCRILVIDDSSPDSTALIVRDLQSEYGGSLELIERPGKAGLSSALQLGLEHGISHDFSFIVQMDADLSHSPDDLPSLLGAAIEGKGGIIVGSRLMRGSRVFGRGAFRVLMTKTVSFVGRCLLGLPISDPSSGYKCYDRSSALPIARGSLHSKGFSFQLESLLIAKYDGVRLSEVPITFYERTRGASKANVSEIVSSISSVSRLVVARFARWFRSQRGELIAWFLWLSFVASRIFVLRYLIGIDTDLSVQGRYAHLIREGSVPFKDFVPEYPPLVFAFTVLPSLLNPDPVHYNGLFRMMSLLVDLGVWAFLLRANRDHPARNLVYLLGTTALGSLVFDRIDLLNGLLLVVAASYLTAQRKNAGSALLGLSISFKFIPVVLLPATLAVACSSAKCRLRMALTTVLVSAIPFGICAVLGGTDFGGLFRYHRDRGVQIESIPASLQMGLMHLGLSGKVVHRFGCFELSTPLSDTLGSVFSFLLIGGVCASPFALRGTRNFRNQIILVYLTMTCIALSLSKVLSPQYFLIVLPLFSLIPISRRWSINAATFVLFALVIGLTGIVFPWRYRELLALMPLDEVLLGIRNLALVALSILLVYRCRTEGDHDLDVRERPA